MKFTYDRSAGLLKTDGNAFCFMYSGDIEHFNLPIWENLAGKGPTPAGSYTLQYLDLNLPENKDYKHMGVYFIFKLVPSPLTRTKINILGRDPDSFFLHWDKNINTNFTASKGCPIPVPSNIQTFNFIRDRVLEGNNIFEVI